MGTSDPSQRQLPHDPDPPVPGNPDVDPTLAEFFADQCPDCCKAHPEAMEYLSRSGNIGLVMRDWPVFGAVSDRAAMITPGAVAQGKYPQVVDAMLAPKGRRLSDADIDGMTGMTFENALRSFQNGYDKRTAMIGRNTGMAQMLGLIDTQSYVVGRDLFPGVTRIAALKQAIEATHKG